MIWSPPILYQALQDSGYNVQPQDTTPESFVIRWGLVKAMIRWVSSVDPLQCMNGYTLGFHITHEPTFCCMHPTFDCLPVDGQNIITHSSSLFQNFFFKQASRFVIWISIKAYQSCVNRWWSSLWTSGVATAVHYCCLWRVGFCLKGLDTLADVRHGLCHEPLYWFISHLSYPLFLILCNLI